mmetsp:Transcript_14964/g.32943  ORF Transcript_14964/g.32943 Transcript_14964/m.32943 type:complete len:249 (+) Transcript_14964:46-792(+)
MANSSMMKSSSKGNKKMWKCASHGTLISPNEKPPPVPSWLSTTSLQTRFPCGSFTSGGPSMNRRKYLSRSTGNLHGLRNDDYAGVSWSLPKMFGDEKYAYSLVDIEDPRYVKEAYEMGRKLTKLFYEQQIVDLEWRRTYKGLLAAEHRRDTLPKDSKATKAHEKEVDDHTTHLKHLQEQRDLYEAHVQAVFTRCEQIKADIRKENFLDEIRETAVNDTMGKFSRDERDFDDWQHKNPFNAASKTRRPF